MKIVNTVATLSFPLSQLLPLFGCKGEKSGQKTHTKKELLHLALLIFVEKGGKKKEKKNTSPSIFAKFVWGKPFFLSSFLCCTMK